MANLYHILDKYPLLNKEDIAIELNELAERLVKSGLLRIDAYQQINFARFSLPRINCNIMFSRRELIDEKLLPRTRSIIGGFLASYYGSKNLETKIDNSLHSLKDEISRYIPIPYVMEMKIARLIVQSIHPVVIELALIEKVQIFFSYSYNIGDVLDVASWQYLGANSGMQSTDGRDVAIYISSGGDPLVQKKEVEDKNSAPRDEPIFGSGKPALARAVIIGGQELGHYADIIRDKNGQQISRHSADFSGRRAKPHVKAARRNDIKYEKHIRHELIKFGIIELIEIERHLKFYKKNRLKNLRVFLKKCSNFFAHKIFFSKISNSNLSILNKFRKSKFPATTIYMMLEDMAFNLAPKADVYKHPNKEIEEAIACIEALARVPQQANKWGQNIVEFIVPNLAKIYYEEVIPRCLQDFEHLTGEKYKLDLNNLSYLSWFQKLLLRLKSKLTNLFGKNNK